MGMLTELEEHGADLAAGRRVDLDDAVLTATAGIPAGVTLGLAGTGRPPAALTPAGPAVRGQAAAAACPRSRVRALVCPGLPTPASDGPSRPFMPPSGGARQVAGRPARIAASGTLPQVPGTSWSGVTQSLSWALEFAPWTPGFARTRGLQYDIPGVPLILRAHPAVCCDGCGRIGARLRG